MATRREKRLQKAEKLVQRGRLEAAIVELHQVLKEAPDDTRTLNRVGDLYARLNRVDEAADLFSKAAERFSKEGFFVKAIAIYKKILRLDPTRIPIYERLAELYQHQGLTNEARGQYQILADYYEQQGDGAAVISVYEKLVAQNPSDTSVSVRLGELLAEAGRLDEALDVYGDIATALLDSDSPDEAVVVFEQAIEAAPESLKFVMNAVMQLQSVDRPELVERFLVKAEELNPEAATARTLLEKAKAAEEPVAVEHAVEAPAESEAAPEFEMDAEPGPETVEAAPEASPEPVSESEPEPADVESAEFEIELDEFETAVEAAPVEPAALDEAALDSLLEEAEIDASVLAEEQARAEEAAEEVAALATLDEALEEIEEPAPAEPSPAEQAPSEPAAVETPAVGVEELLAEADALAGYGLESKAAGRLARALELAPGHLGAYRRLINIEVHARRDAEVVRLAAEAASAALTSGAGAQWREIVADLEHHGYRIEGSKLIPPAPLEAEIPGELLVDAPPDGGEEVEADAIADVDEVPVESATAAAVEAPEDEWLESLDDAEPEADPAPAAVAAEGESQFFDLAAELELELGEQDPLDGDASLGAQTVEEIVHGFKQGMAEVLSPEAFETHYNLGIAYREMGLIDEAIGEFQLAAKDPRYLVECCSLLGQCFAEKDFGDLALKWYRKGLESPHVSEEATLGLLYEVGNLHLASGDREAARAAFAEIYGVNSNFRDVVAKLEELRNDRGA